MAPSSLKDEHLRQPSLSRTPSARSGGAPLEAGGIAVDELEVKGDVDLKDPALQPDRTESGEKTEDASPGAKKDEKYVVADQTLFLPTGRLLIVLAAASTCIFLSFLDQTIVATALPLISSYFASGTESSWVATAYLVASTASQPIYGRLSDIFGRKQVLLGVVAMFSVFSLACAVAQTMLQLIIFRAFQGLSGGGLLTVVMIVMGDLIPLKDRAKYQGITEVMIALANGIGPVLGAVFAEKVSWRWCFYINLPLCAISALLLVVYLPSRPTSGDIRAKLKAIDYFGAVASLAATVLLLMGLTWGGVSYPWKSAQVLVPLVLSGLLLPVFLFWEGKVAQHPVMPLSVFKNTTSAAVLAATFLLGSAYYTLLFQLPNFLQVVLGYSAITSSALLLPFVLLVTFIVLLAGLAISRWGRYREFIIVGFAIWGAAAGSLTTLDARAGIGKIVGLFILNGLGAGLVVQTSVIAVMACAPRKDIGVVMSARNWLRLLGGAIFLAISTTIVNNAFRQRLTGIIEPAILQSILDDPIYIQHTLRNTMDPATFDIIIDAYISAFRTLFFVVMGILLLASAISLLFIRHHSLKRDDDAQLKEEGKRYMEEQKAKKAGKKGPSKEAV